jgi:hypothetical protein
LVASQQGDDMPKLKNVDADEVAVILNDLEAVVIYLGDYADRVQKGYVDDDVATIRRVTELVQASRACSDLAAQLLFRLRFEEDRAETRKLLEAQVKA